MRHFITLLRHELRMLIIAPSTYIAAILFLILMGFIYWAIIRNMALSPQELTATNQFYSLFWLPVFFTVPMLTMRSIAPEKNQSTLETLFSTPAPKSAIVLSKFFAAYILYASLWLATLYFPYISVKVLPTTISNYNLLDGASLAGSITFIGLSGLLFISIGIFTSSLTRSQLIAGMLCFTFLFILCAGAQQLEYATFNYLEPGDFAYETIQYINVFQHYHDFSLGIIDSRPFIFYVTTSLVLLGFTANLI